MKAEATGTMINGMNAALSRVFKRLHYPLDVMLLCVRWYVAYPQDQGGHYPVGRSAVLSHHWKRRSANWKKKRLLLKQN